MDNQNKVISIVTLVILLGAVGWYALNNNQQEQQSVDTTQENQNETQNTAVSEGGTEDPVQSNGKLPEQYQNKVAVVETNKGTFTIEFFDNDAPLAVENFIRLSQAGKYNDSPFHRIIDDLIIQGGDFTRGDGTGGESIWGKPFRDELNPETESYQMGYDRGVVAMANAGASTNGSQFFVNLRNNKSVFPPNYTIFGKVVSGMEVVDAIGNTKTIGGYADEEGSLPAERVFIETVTIEDKQ